MLDLAERKLLLSILDDITIAIGQLEVDADPSSCAPTFCDEARSKLETLRQVWIPQAAKEPCSLCGGREIKTYLTSEGAKVKCCVTCDHADGRGELRSA